MSRPSAMGPLQDTQLAHDTHVLPAASVGLVGIIGSFRQANCLRGCHAVAHELHLARFCEIWSSEFNHIAGVMPALVHQHLFARDWATQPGSRGVYRPCGSVARPRWRRCGQPGDRLPITGVEGEGYAHALAASRRSKSSGDQWLPQPSTATGRLASFATPSRAA